MFSKSASLYDLIYSSFKDYAAEATHIDGLIKSMRPGAKSVLDVACGTGEHARILSERFGYSVDGVDIEPEFVRIAQQKNPHGSFWQADMREFDAGRQYDIVLCLFSAIAYVKTLDGLITTLSNFARHLADGGLIIVEPWFSPEAWKPGTLNMVTAGTESLKVCRMGRSEVEGTISKIIFEYRVGDRNGIHHLQEVHELGLYTVDQMKECFEAAGLSTRYDQQGPSGRGLYLANRTA